MVCWCIHYPLISSRIHGPPFSRMRAHPINPWSYCFPHLSSKAFSILAPLWTNRGQDHGQGHDQKRWLWLLQPPIGQCCYGKRDKRVRFGMKLLGWACCGNTRLRCIEHTFDAHNLGPQLCILGQSIYNITPFHFPTKQISYSFVRNLKYSTFHPSCMFAELVKGSSHNSHTEGSFNPNKSCIGIG